jgi:SGNH domain-containing protein
LEIAINELKQHTRRLILITQPPELPHSGSREAMRDGSRPPFMEDAVERSRRIESNAFVKHFQGGNVLVIDLEPLFEKNDGSIRFIDNNGNLLYQDRDHLSDVGADQVRPDVIKAIRELKSCPAGADCQ